MGSKRKDISMVGTDFQRKHMIRNSGNVLNEVNEYNENVEGLKSNNERRFILKSFLTALLPAKLVLSPRKVLAAPPFAVMSEELGFFPVTNSAGQTVNIPAKVKRASTDQSILLAKHLKAVRSIVLMKFSCKIFFFFFSNDFVWLHILQSKSIMYGAYWCPHCSHQRELFGREAWSYITYVECSPKGYGFDAVALSSKDIDGFPTWTFPNGKKKSTTLTSSGEMPLERLAKLSGYKGSFNVALEGFVPNSSGSCQ